ncbi:Asp-tRNA(Asn)/Glu-tRNA(Gln) amidotransferase subunit GatC [Candidatus Gottesmanbacteria bacterium]|nr:Asp-tRNA(Asn)/Glu-tRNA(Gln) amidotransferase subunit GatC [Candidatus Gottesmanbacteria bacterium]
MIKTNSLSISEVKHVAKLANLPLAKEEAKIFEKQLSITIKFIDHLQELDIKGITETSQVTGKTNELRDDKITPGLSQEETLKNASKIRNGFFVTKIT